MRTLIILAALFAAPAAHAQQIQDLAWMSGCWRSADGRVTEVWDAPQAPVLIGYSYTTGQNASWEQLRIEMIGGWATYVAMPNGAAPTQFRMVEPGAPVTDIVQFANEAHDFPKLIQYVRDGDTLSASLFGDDGSSEVRVDYTRIDCAALRR